MNEEFKNQLRQEGVRSDSHDGLAYQKVFDALSHEPQFQLPHNFADQVIRRIEHKQKESTKRDNLFLILGIGAFIIAGIVGSLMIGFKPDLGIFKFLSGYSGLMIFAIAFVIFIQWLDKRVVRKNLSY